MHSKEIYKSKTRLIKWGLLISSIFVVIIFFIIASYSFFSSSAKKITAEKNQNDDTFLYHIIITGTYENKDFLEKVYEGAEELSKMYNSVVELHIPKSQAENSSLQSLMNYCSFLNADGVIAYINEGDELPSLLRRSDSPEIPLVTLGYFSTDLPQISYIGSNDWEMGKKIANEAIIQIQNSKIKNVVIVSGAVSGNSSNLINSLQVTLQQEPSVRIKVIETLQSDFEFTSDCLFITLNEKDTISAAQIISEEVFKSNIKLIGYGENEVCQLYLQKGWITELISLDTKKIGSSAIRELFEYRSKGSANSYVIADVKVSRM